MRDREREREREGEGEEERERDRERESKTFSRRETPWPLNQVANQRQQQVFVLLSLFFIWICLFHLSN